MYITFNILLPYQHQNDYILLNISCLIYINMLPIFMWFYNNKIDGALPALAKTIMVAKAINHVTNLFTWNVDQDVMCIVCKCGYSKLSYS